MKKIFFWIIIFHTHPVFTQQNVEVNIGVLQNRFHDFENSSFFESDYISEIGYSFKLAFHGQGTKNFQYRMEFGLDKYGGTFYFAQLGSVGEQSVDATVDKSVISFCLYPLVYTFKEKLELDLGMELNRLLFNSYEGIQTIKTLFVPSSIQDIRTLYPNYMNKMHMGIRGRIAYIIKISEKYNLIPQYSFYFGMLNEFAQFPHQIKSMRHHVALGLGWKLE